MSDARPAASEIELLEESLWRAETRFDRAYMDQVLAADFAEFGRSGRVYDKASTLGSPAHDDIRAELPLRNFSVELLTPDVALATYLSVVVGDEVEAANRSSIWIRTGTGWKLRFHQGTPVAAR